MNTDQLRYFTLVYRMGSIAAVAKRIPMSTQGLAKSLVSLESELGVPLFELDESGSRKPTRYAQILADYVNHWENDRSAMTKEFETIKARENKVIRLGASLGIIGMLGLEFCYEFSYGHPEISVAVSELRDDICDDALRDRLFDMTLSLAPFPSDFVTKSLCSIPLSFWIPEGDPLSEKSVIQFDDLEGRNIAIPGHGFKCFDTFLHMCKEQGVQLGEIVTSSEVYKFYDFAMEGKGLGFTAKHIAESPSFKQSTSIKSRPLENFVWTVGISHNAGRKLMRHETLFEEFCSFRVKEMTKMYTQEVSGANND